MQEQNKREIKKLYVTRLLVVVIVYFFLAVVWKYFAPLIVAFLILLAAEPFLDKWSKRLGIGRKVLAYLFLVLLLTGLAAGVWFGLIPYLKACDFGWCERLLKHPWAAKVIAYFQEHGLGDVAGWSASAIQIGSSILFHIGAYGLSVFLLAGVFGRLKSRLLQHMEGRFLLDISNDIISYAKAYLKTQGKLLAIMCILCVPTLMFSGIQGGILLGILAGVLDFLPVFGTGIVLVPTALWQFLEKDYIPAVVCLLLFVVTAVVREILEPKFLGSAVKLPSIGIWISVYAGVQLFGTSGIFKGPIGYLLIHTIFHRLCQDSSTQDDAGVPGKCGKNKYK